MGSSVGHAQKLKRKAAIKQFCGFVYADRVAERANQVQRLVHLTVAQIKELCGLLRLERSGDKVGPRARA